MKKDTSDLLAQIAKAQPATSANMTGSQPAMLPRSQKTTKSAPVRPPATIEATKAKRPGRYKGVYWPEQELEDIRSLRRKLFMENLEVSENLLIRGLVQAGHDNPRLIDILRRLADE